MISGSRLLPGRQGIAYVNSLGGKREAGVPGTRLVIPAANAALANGMSGHADETDDTHPPTLTHPGTSVVPAAMAIGERDRLSGSTALRAIVLGYDICARLLLALNPMPFLRSGHHAGAFGQLFGFAGVLRDWARVDPTGDPSDAPSPALRRIVAARFENHAAIRPTSQRRESRGTASVAP
jgi:hypothetical protein